MAYVSKQIQNADEAISRNIESLAGQRALLSQNVLAQLRNLVEGVVVRIHTGKPDAEFNYAAVKPGLAFVKSKGKLNFLVHCVKEERTVRESVCSAVTVSARSGAIGANVNVVQRVRRSAQDECTDPTGQTRSGAQAALLPGERVADFRREERSDGRDIWVKTAASMSSRSRSSLPTAACWWATTACRSTRATTRPTA